MTCLPYVGQCVVKQGSRLDCLQQGFCIGDIIFTHDTKDSLRFPVPLREPALLIEPEYGDHRAVLDYQLEALVGPAHLFLRVVQFNHFDEAAAQDMQQPDFFGGKAALLFQVENAGTSVFGYFSHKCFRRRLVFSHVILGNDGGKVGKTPREAPAADFLQNEDYPPHTEDAAGFLNQSRKQLFQGTGEVKGCNFIKNR